MASANPFVQRTRNERFSLFLLAHFAGALLGGAAFGAIAGEAGHLAALDRVASAPRLVALCGAALLTAWAERHDLRAVRGWTRQVPERWRYAFRAPVWGFGYGLQLGAAFTTIVASASTWIAFAAAFATGGVGSGVVIGATFGFARAATMLPARRIHDRDSLRTVLAAHGEASQMIGNTLARAHTVAATTVAVVVVALHFVT